MKKKILITVLLILGLGGGLCIWKWNTWFYNPPELPYTTPASPDRVILSYGEDTETERCISWRCDTAVRPAEVELFSDRDSNILRIPATGKVITSRAGKSAFYRASLDGLQPDNTYHYRVRSNDSVSSWYTFRTQDTRNGTNFLFIGDVQDKENGHSVDNFRLLHAAFPRAAFWAFVGDIIERPTDAYWKYWFNTMDGVTPSIPIVAATGNHEYLKGLPKTLDPRWTSTFVNPGNGPEGFEGQSYYLNFPDLCYIVLDTDGIQGPQSLYRHHRWLIDVLENNRKRWTVVMMHHPVYSVRSGRANYYVRWTFRHIFEKYHVALVLQGHDHGYSRISSRDKAGGTVTPVYIVSSSSPKVYAIGFDKIHDRLGANLLLYQYIQAGKDTLRYRSYTYGRELYDDLIITPDGRVTDCARDIPERLEFPFGTKKKDRERAAEYDRLKKQRAIAKGL